MHFALKTDSLTIRGQEIKVRELTAGARGEMLEAARTSPFKAQIVLAQHCILNGDGAPAFGPKDFDKVAALPPDVVQAVADCVLMLSGMMEKSDTPKG